MTANPSSRSLRGLDWVNFFLADVRDANLTRGTGHYNVTLGLVSTAHMVGFFLSQTTAGFVVDATGSFAGGFLYLAAIAFAALVVYYFGVPETLDKNAKADSGTEQRSYSPART